MQEDPKAAQTHMRHPDIAKKVSPGHQRRRQHVGSQAGVVEEQGQQAVLSLAGCCAKKRGESERLLRTALRCSSPHVQPTSLRLCVLRHCSSPARCRSRSWWVRGFCRFGKRGERQRDAPPRSVTMLCILWLHSCVTVYSGCTAV